MDINKDVRIWVVILDTNGSPWLATGSYFGKTEPRASGTFCNTSRASGIACFHKKYKIYQNTELAFLLYFSVYYTLLIYRPGRLLFSRGRNGGLALGQADIY